MTTKLMLTGGTIDKNYNEFNGEFNFIETHMPELLAVGRDRADISVQQLMMKDSLDMTDEDRDIIIKACRTTQAESIVITHGTDTMVETAIKLGQENMSKTIVLVGAMIPYVFKHSDAAFNMGFALAAAQVKSTGVYIAMNGILFDYDKVIKNRELAEFQSIERE
ncbi:MAG: asparaginase domain-containing protein [Cocleimonas sp.]